MNEKDPGNRVFSIAIGHQYDDDILSTMLGAITDSNDMISISLTADAVGLRVPVRHLRSVNTGTPSNCAA